MAQTQIGTDGIKDDAVTTAKIADNAVTFQQLAGNTVKTGNIEGGAVTTDRLADEAVTLAKLEHGTSSNDGKFLRANNGADPTFETVTGTTINNNADNRVITGSGTANTLEGEANLTYDGTTFNIGNTALSSNQLKFTPSGNCFIDNYTNGGDIQFRTSVTSAVDTISVKVTSTGNLAFYSGKGIDFSGTSDTSGMSSELLDDYEEGTWTPTVAGWDTYTPYTGSSYNVAWYTKVGNLVHIGWKIYIQNLTTVSSSAYVRFQNLPFAMKSTHAGGIAAPIRFDIPEFGFSGYQITYIAGGETTLYTYKHVSGGNSFTSIDATSNYSNVWTMGSATYLTN